MFYVARQKSMNVKWIHANTPQLPLILFLLQLLLLQLLLTLFLHALQGYGAIVDSLAASRISDHDHLDFTLE